MYLMLTLQRNEDSLTMYLMLTPQTNEDSPVTKRIK